MAKPIPSALPAPVITAVCLFQGRFMEMSAEGIIPRSRKIAIRLVGCEFLLIAERRGWPGWTVAELASTARGFLVADASGVYGFFVAWKRGQPYPHGSIIVKGEKHDATAAPSRPE